MQNNLKNVFTFVAQTDSETSNSKSKSLIPESFFYLKEIELRVNPTIIRTYPGILAPFQPFLSISLF